MIYLHLLMVALVVIYIVDISGFTESWLTFLSHYMGRKLVELKPFSCGKCMTWWVCLIYALASGAFGIGTIAFSALLSLLSIPLGQLLIALREGLAWLINKITITW